MIAVIVAIQTHPLLMGIEKTGFPTMLCKCALFYFNGNFTPFYKLLMRTFVHHWIIYLN